MIGLDTNVLVRYLVKDDGVQSAIASKFMDGLRMIQDLLVRLSWPRQVGSCPPHMNWAVKKLLM